ncbi:Imidazole glycerol phosphate synthase subunit HisF (IGP synthase cyclase subunit) (IGP synthase subunit HisF) (ImGP synthase subunit HisF) (IGPS subunit HisF), partial [Durusdinium trenchii]
MLSGPNTDLYADLAKSVPGMAWQASGGVSSLEDLSALKAAGANGAIIGKALYEKKFTLEEDGRVVKGVRFRNHADVGDIVDLAARYAREGADELVFYDISASPDGRSVDPEWVRRVAEVIDIPFCVAGGIRSVDDARARLFAGADKVSVNSPALADPSLVDRLAAEFGRQCIVVGVDSRMSGNGWRVHSNTGDPGKTRTENRLTMAWIAEVTDRGAGEIVLNCMDEDGVRQGYDIGQLATAREICPVPLIASGGAGAPEHFRDVFAEARVDGALAASVFHKQVIGIGALKAYLAGEGIEVLMLGYMNADAGETSGHTLTLESLSIDCDKDTILVRAIPTGPVCHTGTDTCFAGDSPPALGFLTELEGVIAARRAADPSDSDVARLHAAGISKIAQKVGEEGVETALAAVTEDDVSLTSEAADLLFHLMVALQ